MQGVRKIEKSVVGVRNCVNNLGIKLSIHRLVEVSL